MADTVKARGSPIPARYILAVLGSIGMAIVYGLKVNLSVAMVAMVNQTALIEIEYRNTSQYDEALANRTLELAKPDTIPDGPFVWEKPVQGLLKSCYFWGYLVSQLPAAKIAESFSAKWVMFFSVVINIVCTLLTPVMSKVHYSLLILMRIGEGIGGGVTFPAMHVMLASWAPPNERSMMSSIVYAGTSLGTVISMLMTGLLAKAWGWESVFYVMGVLSLIWTALWPILTQDTPEKQPFISAEERVMITSSLGTGDAHQKTKVKGPVPWVKVLTSIPFLAILVAHTCSNFGWYLFLIDLPFYMKEVLHFDLDYIGVATSVPFLTMWIFSMVISTTLDMQRKKGKITTTTARKIATLFASVVPMVCLIILCIIGSQPILAAIIVGVGITCIGGMFCGFLSNHIDLAPNFAGTLMALTNTAATIGGIFVPIFVGYVTKGNQTIDAWRIIFYVAIALYALEVVVYTMFGSGEEQQWNRIGGIPGELQEVTPLKGADGEGEEKNSYTVNK